MHYNTGFIGLAFLPDSQTDLYSFDHSGFFFSAKAVIPVDVLASHCSPNVTHISKIRPKLTNLLILTPKQTMEQPPFILHPLPQRQLLTLIHNLLPRNNSNPTIPRNRLRRLHRNLKQLLLPALHNLRRKTPLPGLLTAEVLPRQDKLHRLALADGAGEALRAAGAGDRAELDLGLAEGCGRGAVEDVAHHGELTAAAEGVAGYGGDDRLAD